MTPPQEHGFRPAGAGYSPRRYTVRPAPAAARPSAVPRATRTVAELLDPETAQLRALCILARSFALLCEQWLGEGWCDGPSPDASAGLPGPSGDESECGPVAGDWGAALDAEHRQRIAREHDAEQHQRALEADAVRRVPAPYVQHGPSKLDPDNPDSFEVPQVSDDGWDVILRGLARQGRHAIIRWARTNQRPFAFPACRAGRWCGQTCVDGHRVAQWQGCGRLRCPDCAPHNKSERGKKAFNVLLAVNERESPSREPGDDDDDDHTDDVGGMCSLHRHKYHDVLQADLGQCVLTMPPWLVARLRPGDERKLKRVAHDTVQAWLRKVHDLDDEWRFGSGVWFHPTGDADDVGQEEDSGHPAWARAADHMHPHWNVMCPLVAQHRGTGEYRLFPGYVGRHDDEEWQRAERMMWLRDMWSVRLAAFYGVDIPGEVDVHYSFKADDIRKRFSLNYMARPFPAWPWDSQASAYHGLCGNQVWTGHKRQLVELGHTRVGVRTPCPFSRRCAECGEKFGACGRPVVRLDVSDQVPTQDRDRHRPFYAWKCPSCSVVRGTTGPPSTASPSQPGASI